MSYINFYNYFIDASAEKTFTRWHVRSIDCKCKSNKVYKI